jgi:outer membrane protein OmpA-like peptidoglycan-associated protein
MKRVTGLALWVLAYANCMCAQQLGTTQMPTDGMVGALVLTDTYKSLGLKGGNRDVGGLVDVWDYGYNASQQWRFVRVAEGVYQLVSMLSGHCLTAPTGQSGTATQQPVSSLNRLQHWRIEPLGIGHIALRNVQTGAYLQVTGRQPNNLALAEAGREPYSFSILPVRPPHLLPDATFSAGPQALPVGTVNTPAREVGPVVTADGTQLYFTRQAYPGAIGGANDWGDIFVTTQLNGNWTQPERLGPPLNTAAANEVSAITPDGNTMLLAGRYRESQHSVEPYLSVRRNGQWQAPIPIEPEGYRNLSTDSRLNSHLSANADVMIMSMKPDTTYGMRDLFVSFKNPQGGWSRPLNLGPVINTAWDDADPFLAPDMRTLYFVSNGQPGYGSYDVFMTRRTGEGWTEWTTPVNLGPSVNHNGWNGYFSVTAKGDWAYYVRDADLYRIPLPQPLRPLPSAIVRGRVLNAKTQQPLETDLLYTNLGNQRPAGTAHSNPQSGAYQIVLPGGCNYSFYAQAPGFYAVSENLDLTQLGAYTEMERDILMQPIEVGEVIRLNNVFFDTGKADLRPESKTELDRLHELLQANPGLRIQIEGHTDNVGSDADNLALSQNRCNSVVAYLVAKGIAPARLQAKGFGEARPIAPNDTDSGRQQNRRVEFRILAQ